MGLAPSKVKWLRNRKILAAFALLILVVCIGIFFVTTRVFGRQSSGETLRVNGREFSLEVAATQQARKLGLGNRALLPKNHGMLFVFSQAAVECFWMKDMYFPIDIIWIDASKKVVHIEPNVSPSSYPHSSCPNNPTKYVIELNAGAAKSAGI